MMFARLLFALLAAASTSMAYAACPMQKTQINGRLQSKGAAVAGATLQVTWDERRTRGLSAQTRSTADGSFELSLSIETFDGRTMLGKEKCGYMPDEFIVEVRNVDHRDFKKSYELDDLDKPLIIELRAR
jgi:hypothetical protein